MPIAERESGEQLCLQNLTLTSFPAGLAFSGRAGIFPPAFYDGREAFRQADGGKPHRGLKTRWLH
jgi:hypothetical protein